MLVVLIFILNRYNQKYRISIKNVKTIFLSFLFIFLAHYVYNTVTIMYGYNNTESVINIDDFDSEEENTETENEVKELDEYLIHPISDIISLSLEMANRQYVNKMLLLQFKEVDSPPPVI